MTIEAAVFQFGITLFAIITTAFLTVRLNLSRYYREKWWEAKMRAYTDIIQALHHMKRELEISIPAEYEQRDTETEYHKQWSEKHRTAWDEIRRQRDVGEFLFSPASLKHLQALIDESVGGPSGMYVEHLETMQAAVNKCLPAIKASARIDLGLPKLSGR